VSVEAKRSPSLLLDVGGMMCGACACRVRTILVADQRVESAAVNMLAETAAVRLRPGLDSLVSLFLLSSNNFF
jgi:cation transport ATPase